MDWLAGEASEPMARAKQWAKTMHGHLNQLPDQQSLDGQGLENVVFAHADSAAKIAPGPIIDRLCREEHEAQWLRPGATLAKGAGNRAIPEQPDPQRTCFERDRDRVVHSSAFRRLAGKTQVVVFPTDHQRTRLTHALEVAQVAESIAKGIGANVALASAIALAHDCGHGPGGHASEDAFDQFLPEGFDHATWGADVALTSLNLCAETLDGVRNHSWSRPAPATIEGEICSWADRIAYCAHDLEDAIRSNIVAESDLPAEIVAAIGVSRREHLGAFIRAMVSSTNATGMVSMPQSMADILAKLRSFNYERIYTRPDSVAQSKSMVKVLCALVEHYIGCESDLPANYRSDDKVRSAVTYVAGMTDRFAFLQAKKLLNWKDSDLPKGIGYGA